MALSVLEGRRLINLYQMIKQQLVIWAKLPISWFRRIAVITMNVLPCFIFIFVTMNLYIPNKIITTIQATINRFIWNSKPARIKAVTLQQNISEEGLALPNILKYYRVVQLVTITQW